MSRPEADPIQLPDGPLQALARAELLLLRLSAQLELARLAFDSADEAARDYALTHASELTRQLREAFNLAISGYEHEVVGAASKLEGPLWEIARDHSDVLAIAAKVIYRNFEKDRKASIWKVGLCLIGSFLWPEKSFLQF
jgi:hypothetical protein